MEPSAPLDRLFACMSDGTKPMTWGDMVERRGRIASSLTKRLPGNILAGAVYSKNCPDWLLSHQVIQTMGLRFSPINWHLVADEIAYIVHDCDADVLFFGAEYADVVRKMQPQLPKVRLFVAIDGACEGFVSLDDLIAESPPGSRCPPHNRTGGSVSYTGGTTGKPKGAFRKAPPQMKADNPAREAVMREWGLDRLMPHPIHLVSAPMYHALPMAWYMRGLSLGFTFILSRRFEALKALEAINRHQVNSMYMPPVLLKRILQLPLKDRKMYDTSTIKTIMTGGAPCATSVKEGIFEMFGAVLFELYGASELGSVAIMPPWEMMKRLHSVGRPCHGYEVILLDDDKRRITTPRVAGEIYARGMNIEGYHKLEAKTKESMFEDYFSVGDVGFLDEDGFLYITDRKIDMVVSGGVNIYPAQVEEVLHKHPDIEDLAVFGVPDPEFGEKVHAAVKVAPGRNLSGKDLLQWAEGKIGKFQLPREADISFHAEDFPRSEAGKLRKKELRQHVISLPGAPTSKL